MGMVNIYGAVNGQHSLRDFYFIFFLLLNTVNSKKTGGENVHSNVGVKGEVGESAL